MKILLVGGGSGGHITPLLAVASQLKKDNKSVSVHIVSERFSKFSKILADGPSYITVHRIFAGKFRRYHGESWLEKISDLKTIFLNLRDAFLVVAGFLESLLLLLRIKPDVVFIKGGYVGVPIGIACRFLRIKYITHDSDATAGLANKIIGSGATINAVGMPGGNYPYKPDKTVLVGVPISLDFKYVNEKKARKDLGLSSSDQLLLILGGSNGAQRLDKIVVNSLEPIMAQNKNLKVIHQVGEGNEKIYSKYPPGIRNRINTLRFIAPLAPVLSAADLVISRAGATTIAEISIMSKPVILVPHPELAGGHQVLNAQALDSAQAAINLDEKAATKDVRLMKDAIKRLLVSDELRIKLAKNISKIIEKNSTAKISKIILDTANK